MQTPLVSVPEQTEIYLASEGLNDREATLHRYTHSERVTIKHRVTGEEITGTRHFYKCTVTGSMRSWGFTS